MQRECKQRCRPINSLTKCDLSMMAPVHMLLCIQSLDVLHRCSAFLVWERKALEDNTTSGRTETRTPCLLIANHIVKCCFHILSFQRYFSLRKTTCSMYVLPDLVCMQLCNCATLKLCCNCATLQLCILS